MPEQELATIAEVEDKRKDGQLVGFRCANEHTFVSPVRACPKCGTREIENVELPEQGTVVTFTIQNVASEEFMNETPFAWAIVELEDGSRVTGWVPFVGSEDDLSIGDEVEFEPTYKPGVMFEKV
jgi:uncharacterized OB-fold protein